MSAPLRALCKSPTPKALTANPLLALQDRKRSQGGGVLSALSRLHLSPVIWGIILGMLGMLAYSVMQNSQFPPPNQVGPGLHAGCPGPPGMVIFVRPNGA